MNLLVVASLFLLTACLGGCAAPAPQAGTGPPTPAAVAVPMLRNVTVNVAFTSPGASGPYAGYDSPTCGPAQPGVCQANVPETIYPAGPLPFNGTFFDTAHARLDTTVGLYLGGTFVFTGSISGCTGSGTVTFPYTAAPDKTPVAANANGEVVHGHDFLTAPTESTGFARVADARIDADFDISPVTYKVSRGMLTGYLLCE